MLKKLCALIMIFTVAASVFAVNAAATDTSYLKRGEIRHYVDGKQFDSTTDKVEAGQTVTAEATVQNIITGEKGDTGTTSQYAFLITALYDSKNKMVAISDLVSGRQWIGKDKYKVNTSTVTAPAGTVGEEYTVKSFLWNNMLELVPCNTVATDIPDAPTGVTVTTTDGGKLVSWSAVAAAATDASFQGYNVYRNDVKIAAVTGGKVSYLDSEVSDAAVYKVTAVGWNESAMSDEAEEIEYVTAKLDMNEVEKFFTSSEPLVANDTYESYSFGDLDLYVSDATIAAYDKDFATNKTENTFGFATKTDDDGVSKSCLATNDLQQNKFMIEIPADSEVLTSPTKTITITVLDNSNTDINFRYFPTEGSRADVKLKRTNSGKWVTLSATVNDSRTTNGNYNQYHFELGRGDSDKYGEIYIADISISAPKTASAE